MRERRAERAGAGRTTLRDVLFDGSRKRARRGAAGDDGRACATAMKLRYADRDDEDMAQDAPEFESALEAYPVRLEHFEGPLDLLHSPHQARTR